MKRARVCVFLLAVFIVLLSLFGCSSGLEGGEVLPGVSQVDAEKNGKEN